MRRPSLFLAGIACATGLTLAGCGDATAPSQDATDLLRLRLALAPQTVSGGDEFRAEVTLINVTADTVTLGAPSSCIAFVGVYRNGTRQSGFAGTDYLCLAVVSSWPIPSGDSITPAWMIRAGTPDRPPAAAEYRFRVDFNVRPELPRLEHRFVLR